MPVILVVLRKKNGKNDRDFGSSKREQGLKAASCVLSAQTNFPYMNTRYIIPKGTEVWLVAALENAHLQEPLIPHSFVTERDVTYYPSDRPEVGTGEFQIIIKLLEKHDYIKKGYAFRLPKNKLGWTWLIANRENGMHTEQQHG